MEDALPWEQGVEANFKQFNDQYTLHDSFWIGIFYDVAFAQTVTLAIRMDAVWLPDRLKQHIPSPSYVDNWPYLFIRLCEVEQISTARYADVGGDCRAIAYHEFEEVEQTKVLAIDDIYGGQVTIIYQGIETFLTLDKHRQIIQLFDNNQKA
ncbi:MAG: hypothetical protein AAGM36_09400 [Cyanobacteria bacterium J06597_1]